MIYYIDFPMNDVDLTMLILYFVVVSPYIGFSSLRVFDTVCSEISYPKCRGAP